MMTFQEESVAAVWDELYPLAHAHHASTENYKRHEPFAPKKERYVQYEQLGMFHLLTARDQGRLVGYFGVYLTQSMHSQLPIATEDTFYLSPSHRGGRNALRFLGYVERFISRFAPPGGSIEVLFSCEEDNASGIKKLLHYLAYKPVIMVHSKHLPHCADSAPSSSEVPHGVGV